MRSKTGHSLVAAGVVLLAAVVLLLAGCFSFDLGSVIGRQIAPQPSEQPAPESKQAPKGAGPGVAYQFQFNAFFGSFWNMGWFGYKDPNYKPGQGTVWTFTVSGKPKETMTLERALLKVNADGTRWWRLRVDADGDTILYEFLVAADSTVKKVRYKDPDTGSIQEFVPSQQPSGGPAAPSAEEMAKYKVDRQAVKVKAGTFDADHYRYTDPKGSGTTESWVSQAVPGYVVKTIFTAAKDKETSTGELTQIVSGVTSVLGSF